ncbi:MAG: hypothetical protein JSU68_12205 [Phycisphaerales bacterium]|nr:MAG: hypothetical protein JSU68_12205 [Phycisphaerales bacterium]
MNIKATLGALIGAILGAAIWGAVAAWTEYEWGFIAWIVGGLVGGGAMILQGSGTKMGVLCAILALGSIFLGKMWAVKFYLPGEIHKELSTQIERDDYEEARRDAEDFTKLTTETQYPEFMVTHDFTDATSADEVSSEEVEDFMHYQVPRLVAFHQEQPGFETWRATEVDHVVDLIMSDVSLAEAAIDSLGIFDAIFALLGLATAYKLGAGVD